MRNGKLADSMDEPIGYEDLDIQNTPIKLRKANFYINKRIL